MSVGTSISPRVATRGLAPPRASTAFTLVELLVVIAIIGILIALLLPAVQAAREAARRTHCSNNLKQVGLALRMYHSSYEQFPSGALLVATVSKSNNTWCTSPNVSHGYAPWTVLVLPFLEQQNLYDQFDFGQPFSDASFYTPSPNRDVVVPLAVYQCPTDFDLQNPTPNNYWAVMGGGSTAACSGQSGQRDFFINGTLYVNSMIRLAHIRDGTSNTFLLGETRYMGRNNMWTSSGKTNSLAAVLNLVGCKEQINLHPPGTYNVPVVWRGFSSHHAGGCLAAMGDGSVHFVSESIALDIYQQLGVRNDGLPAGGLPLP